MLIKGNVFCLAQLESFHLSRENDERVTDENDDFILCIDKVNKIKINEMFHGHQ